MKVIKYTKSKNNTYKILLDNDKELIYYEDVILQTNLLQKRKITEEDIQEMNKINLEYDVYYVALKSLKTRFKSIYEMKLFLLKKEYPEELITKAIDKLIKQGYLNDKMYAKSYLNEQLLTTSNGPFKIKRLLEDKKISEEIIKEVLEQFSEEEQITKIAKLIEKKIKANHSKGGIVLKQKIAMDLKNLGYDISLINNGLSKIDFSQDQEIAKKEYEKLRRKYEKKYQGEELERIIKSKLYQKGLKIEEMS